MYVPVRMEIVFSRPMAVGVLPMVVMGTMGMIMWMIVMMVMVMVMVILVTVVVAVLVVMAMVMLMGTVVMAVGMLPAGRFRGQYHIKPSRINAAFFSSSDLDVVSRHLKTCEGLQKMRLISAEIQQRRYSHISADARVAFQI